MPNLSMTGWVLLFLAVAVLDMLVGFASWKKQQLVSGILSKVMLFAMATTVFYAGSIYFAGYFVSSFFSSLYFMGVDLLLVYLFAFVLKFCDFTFSGFLNGKIKYLLLWILADLVILFVNPFWEIAISYVPTEVGSTILYKYNPHLLYELHLVLCYLMVALIVGVLCYRISRTPSIYLRKYNLVLLVFLADVFLNVLYLLGAKYFQLDISVLFYSLSAILIYYAVFSTIPRSLLNTTRNYVMNNMEAAILIFDYEDRVIDANRSARQLFPELTPEQQNTSMAVSVPEYFRSRSFPTFADGTLEFQWRSDDERQFLCRKHDFTDSRGRLVGRMLMMHDVSYQKDTVTGLDMTPGLHRYINGLNRSVNYPVQILLVNVNGLGVLNSLMGREQGDMIMNRTAAITQAVVGKEVYIARLENGNLAAILLKTTGTTAANLGREIRTLVRRDTTLGIRFDAEFGIAEVSERQPDFLLAIQEAESSLKNRKMLSGNSHESPIIQSLTQTLLESDFETEAHVERTRAASRAIAVTMGLTDRQSSALELLCLLHDVGKVAIPNDILLKPGKLTQEEWEIMKTHTDKGYRIAMTSPELRDIAELILHHHERWDGKGYPSGLQGEDIPLLDRIITVLDSYDVMTHDRPYHKAISMEAAKEELLRCSGTQFDPRVVECFLQSLS